MKKKNIINLIKFHVEHNDASFRSEAYEVAKVFDVAGDSQLAQHIMALLSNVNTFVPQAQEDVSIFLQTVELGRSPLPLPESIAADIKGVVNAINRNIGINKFLFQGAPGTGKTESVKQLSRILERELFMVDFDAIVDSRLGQTSKNVAQLFQEINDLTFPNKAIILFDEIDALALERTSPHDLREMGRATSSVLKGLDRLNENVVLVATTNLYNSFDKALSRRFDSVIDFNRYSREDLLDVAESLLKSNLDTGIDTRLLRKIIGGMETIPYPGDLKNLIKTSVAFSDISDKTDYLRRLYVAAYGEKPTDIRALHEQGFTIREIEILSGISKSQVARGLKE